MIYKNYIENGTTDPSIPNYATKFSVSTSDVLDAIPGATSYDNLSSGVPILLLDSQNLRIVIGEDWTTRRSLSTQYQLVIKKGNITKNLSFTKVYPTMVDGEPATGIILSPDTDPGIFLDFTSSSGAPGATGTTHLSLYAQNDYAYNVLSHGFSVSKSSQNLNSQVFQATLSWINDNRVVKNILRWRAVPVSVPTAGSKITTLYNGTGYQPWGVAVDSGGDVYFSDAFSSSLYKLSGELFTPLLTGFLTSPIGVSLDTKGNVYVADYGGNKVWIVPKTGAPSIIGSGFSEPTDVAVDSAGNVYVTDSGHGEIKMISASDNSISVLISGLIFPSGIALDSSGNIYFADNDAQTVNFSPVGATSFSVIANVTAPLGLAIDQDYIYVTDLSGGGVNRISKTTHAVETLPLGITGSYYATGAYVDSQGSLYTCGYTEYAGIINKVSTGYLDTTGRVDYVSVSEGGHGYSDGQEVIFSGGGGSGAAATIQTTAGGVGYVVMSDYGVGYSSVPSASIAGGGTGASLHPAVSLYSDWNYVTVDPHNPTYTIQNLDKYLEYEWEVYSATDDHQTFSNYSASSTFKFF